MRRCEWVSGEPTSTISTSSGVMRKGGKCLSVLPPATATSVASSRPVITTSAVPP
jgi:hypothetical protein